MGVRDVMRQYREKHRQPGGLDPGAAATTITTAKVPIGGVFQHYPVDYPKIVHLIRGRKLNIKDAAKGIGINPKNLSLICKGAIMRPRVGTIEKISTFFGINPEDLYRGQDEN